MEIHHTPSDGACPWQKAYSSCMWTPHSAAHISLQVVEEIVSNVGVIEKLTNFQHKDANGRDWGLNVRQRAKELTSLVTDAERIRGERSKVC